MEKVSRNIVFINELFGDFARCEETIDMVLVLMNPSRHAQGVLMIENVGGKINEVLVVNDSFVPCVHFVIFTWNGLTLGKLLESRKLFHLGFVFIFLLNVVPNQGGKGIIHKGNDVINSFIYKVEHH